MDLTLAEFIRRLLRESWERKVLVSCLFIISSLVFLLLALNWPKIYTSSSTIRIDQQNILNPLMQGTAVTASASDRTRIARESVHSRHSMEKILASAGWFDDIPNAQEKDLMIEDIKKNTTFSNVGENLLRISYVDSEPRRAFTTTELMTKIFIEESLKGKQAESREAFDFIDSQAETYHKKLQDVNAAIKKFSAINVDASIAAETASDARVLDLKRQIEVVSLELFEEESKLKALIAQLAGEGGMINAASFARENRLSTRKQALNEQLANLRLTYMDNYPDIIQLKNQILVLTEQIAKELKARESGSTQMRSELREGPLAEELRRSSLQTKAKISSLGSRKEQLSKLLVKERKTRDDINDVKTEIAELNRDYEVNQQMYQRLLVQRENAFVSMNIDIKNQGLSVKIQESASMPVNPKGIRFAHIIMAGIIISLTLPFGVAFLLSLMDQKARSVRHISQELELPVLASVYLMLTPDKERAIYTKLAIIGIIILSMWSLYGFHIYQKITGIS